MPEPKSRRRLSICPKCMAVLVPPQPDPVRSRRQFERQAWPPFEGRARPDRGPRCWSLKKGSHIPIHGRRPRRPGKRVPSVAQRPGKTTDRRRSARATGSGLLRLAQLSRAAATNRASVPTISYPRSDFEDCARRACCARMTASSASTLFFSSSVRTALFRGGGMSWTAGKAGAICGRFGASCGMPPAEIGRRRVTARRISSDRYG
jgi:hypothetical protein